MEMNKVLRTVALILSASYCAAAFVVNDRDDAIPPPGIIKRGAFAVNERYRAQPPRRHPPHGLIKRSIEIAEKPTIEIAEIPTIEIAEKPTIEIAEKPTTILRKVQEDGERADIYMRRL